MTNKMVNHLYITEQTVNQIVDDYLIKKTDELFSDLNKIVPELPAFMEFNDRYYYLKDKDIFFDFETGYIFPNLKNFFTKENPGMDFCNFKGQAMPEQEINDILNRCSDFPLKCKGKIIYVNGSNTSKDKKGTSWEHAFTDFNDAINKANPGDQIWVAQGEYVGAFSLKDGVEVYGGFMGKETEGWQRNIKRFQTVFKGNSDNVFINKNLGSATLLDGVTITNPNGRGMHNENASFMVRNCSFKENIFKASGAGLLIHSSDIRLFNCTFANNTTENDGGALCISNSTALILSCSFVNNKSNYGSGVYGGGAVFIDSETNLSLISSQFKQNTSKRYGGAINNYHNQKHLMCNCTFENNKSEENSSYNDIYNDNFDRKELKDLPQNIKDLMNTKKIPCIKINKKEIIRVNHLKVLLENRLFSLKELVFESENDRMKFFDYLEESEGSIFIDSEKLKANIIGNKVKFRVNGLTLDKEELVKQIQAGKSAVKFDKELIYDILLNCDKRRADLDSYDQKIVDDVNSGHWDLWETDAIGKFKIELDQRLSARNPKADVRKKGFIAIDFGTKSTVVVFQKEGEHTMPMRIGEGHLSKEIDTRHYENPTVIEFIDIANFNKAYQAKKGRPETLWNDVTVSYTAFNSLMSNTSDHYYTVLSDLKQWAGDSNRKLLIKDKKNKEAQPIDLPTFLNLSDDDINPIEIYAYYIGLYINNMTNGIYHKYLLSFPPSYKKEVREKLIESYTKGFQKSLPETLLNDQEFMKEFKVMEGASEPAAYAVCALQQYAFEPTGDEKIFYAIFDFGGGTTDFDFGIWQESSPQETDIYDYVIEHFFSKGIDHLGGENLLEILAFEVFKMNQDNLREEKISFILPKTRKEFLGCETLLKKTQEAKLNTKQLMEKLRPFWEKSEAGLENNESEAKEKDNQKEDATDKGIIKVDLVDNNGSPRQSYELKVDKDMIDKIIFKEINEGIENFFEALRLAFEKPGLEKIEKINIFLAGNSSKSLVVKKIFNQKIAELTEAINQNTKTDTQRFELFPPLGTPEAKAIQIERGFDVESQEIQPNGKTGVAFGLIESRKGGRIKVINRNLDENNQTAFKFYLGINKKKKFKVLIDKEIKYNQWYKFIHAVNNDFEIYYSMLPTATTGNLGIQDAQRQCATIETTDENGFIWIRAVSPSLIQYTVAKDKEINKSIKENQIYTLELND